MEIKELFHKRMKTIREEMAVKKCKLESKLGKWKLF